MDDLRSLGGRAAPHSGAFSPSGELSSALPLKTTVVCGCSVNAVTLGFTVMVHDHSHTHHVGAMKQISEAAVSQRDVAI